MTDEELQSRIEAGDPLESREANAYRRIIRVLHREPDFVLPATFANSVISRIGTTRAEDSKDMFWLYAGVAACLITLLVAILLTGFQFTFGAFRFLSGYPGLIAFAIGFILGLQWLDRKFVRKAI